MSCPTASQTRPIISSRVSSVVSPRLSDSSNSVALLAPGQLLVGDAHLFGLPLQLFRLALQAPRSAARPVSSREASSRLIDSNCRLFRCSSSDCASSLSCAPISAVHHTGDEEKVNLDEREVDDPFGEIQ